MSADSIDEAMARLSFTAPVDFPSRFKGLTSDRLFELEYGPDGTGSDMDAPQEYVVQLLIDLTHWRERLLAGICTDADEYRRALDSVREAWLQYSFRIVDGPQFPYPFDLPQGVDS